MWAPLRYPEYRRIWLALTVANVGTCMHDMGAGWLMARLTDSSLLIALVQTAASLPFLIFVLPAGVLADLADRRKILKAALGWMIGSALALAAMTATGITTPAVVIGLTLSLAIGSAVMNPPMNSAIPALVPREHLAGAVTLRTMSINVARAAGPIAAGQLIRILGPASAFLCNGLAFVGVWLTVSRWPAAPDNRPRAARNYRSALIEVVQFTSRSPVMRNLLLKGAIVFFFGGALWALLPAVAVRNLQVTPAIYGGLMACIGVGALIATRVLAYLYARIPREITMGAAATGLALALAGMGSANGAALLAVALAVGGACWQALFSMVFVSVQIVVPDRLRARGLAMAMLATMTAMALGSALWGFMADRYGTRLALPLAGAGLALCVLATLFFRVTSSIDEETSRD